MHTEAKPVGLVRTMIRVLPEYHDLYFIEWRGIKCLKDVGACRINGDALLFFGLDVIYDLFEIGLFEFSFEHVLP